MRGIRTVFLWAAIALLPASAWAVTADQIVALKKAGVTDAVILALIERDHTVISLQPEQIVALKREGLSEAIIIGMLKSGQAGEEALRAESAATSAAISAALAPGPDVIIVGHGPDRPNTYHYDGFFSNQTSPPFFVPPYSAPYVVPEAVPYGVAPRFAPRGDRGLRPRALCYAQLNTSANRSNSPLTFVTECPPVLQPNRKFAR